MIVVLGVFSHVTLWALSNLNNYWVTNMMALVFHILSYLTDFQRGSKPDRTYYSFALSNVYVWK